MATGSLELGLFTAPVERRSAVVAAAWVAGALALTLACPGVPFVLAPALFGVAHVAADYRYLMVRRSLPRELFVGILGSAALLVALRGLEAAIPAGLVFPRLEVAVGWTVAVVAVALGSRGRRPLARLLLTVPLALVGVAAVSAPLTARLCFAHAHNLVGVALYFALFRPRSAKAAVPVAFALAAAAWLLVAAPVPFTSFAPAWGARMLADTGAALPPALRSDLGIGLGMSYVFLQLVHYGVWLAFVPIADASVSSTPGETRRSLAADFGPLVLGGTILAALVMIGASFLDVHRTRQVYLSVATFHGYLELAAGGFLLARGGFARVARG
jgi:hypothetical protein